MKKNLVRFLALALVAILALALLPLGALAREPVEVQKSVFDKTNPVIPDMIDWLGSEHYLSGDTIKTSQYDKLYKDVNGDLYDFRGFATTEAFQKECNKVYEKYDKGEITEDELNAAIEKIGDNTKLTFQNKNITIDKFPTSGNAEDEQKWWFKWGWVIAGYTPHAHKLSNWISDGTTHWRNCLVCGEQFIYQNWCQDGDENGICNICGGEVPYHDITVIESEGGKVTVNKETASHRTKITADVEPADGYKLNKLHFTKVRDDGSKQEITRKKQGSQYWTYMPTYDLEVTAEFIKK